MGGYLAVLDDTREQFTVFNDSAVLQVLQGPAPFLPFSFRLLSYSLSESLSVSLCVSFCVSVYLGLCVCVRARTCVCVCVCVCV